jgi:hypothetical protein
MNEVKFPDVTVPMVGEDGNVFAVIGRVKQAMERAGYREEAQAFVRAATACDSYDEVLGLVMQWVDVS